MKKNEKLEKSGDSYSIVARPAFAWPSMRGELAAPGHRRWQRGGSPGNVIDSMMNPRRSSRQGRRIHDSAAKRPTAPTALAGGYCV